MPSAQHVMLAIHVKRTEAVELKNPILAYIRENYSDRDADDALDDLVTIQALRQEVITAQAAAQPGAKDIYLKCGEQRRRHSSPTPTHRMPRLHAGGIPA